MTAPKLVPADLTELPVLMPFLVAAGVLELSRTHAYDLQARGDFPVPVVTVGKRLRVRRVDLLAYLGVTAGNSTAA